MNVQRFRAPTMRQAIASIRAEMGSEAVIIHSSEGPSGAEVVAATEYDEKLASFIMAAADAGGAADDAASGNARLAAGKPDRAAPPAAYVASTAAPVAAGAPEGLASPAASPPGVGVAADSKRTSSRPEDHDPAVAAAARVLGRTRVFGASDADEAAEAPALYDARGMHESGAPPQADGEEAEAPRRSDHLDDVGAELRSLRDLLEAQVSELAWRDVQQRHPQRARVLKRLLGLGLTPALSTSLVDCLDYGATDHDSFELAKADLASRINIADGHELLLDGGLVALVGPTGAGKTTTIAKLAGAHILRHGPGSVGLVTTDDYRLGAQEQLQAFGRILDISVVRARDSEELLSAVHGFRNRSLVLIDTEGGAARATAQRRMLADLAEDKLQLRRFVVLSANAQRASLVRTLNTFGLENLNGAVITKLDECGALGDVLSALVSTRLPVTFVTDGQQVPQDLHQADASDLVARAQQLSQTADDGDVLNDEVLGLTLSSLNANAVHNTLGGIAAGARV